MTDANILRRQVLAGLAWASATRLLGQLLNWAMTIVAIRFLTPADYGLMAVTMAIVGLLHALSYVGVSDVLVQTQDMDESRQSKAFGIVLATNVVFAMALSVAAYPISWFYEQPRLVALLQVASLSFVILAVSAMSRAELDRALAVKHTSRVEITGNLVGGMAVVVLAWAGFGVWSLMIGMLLGLASQAAGLLLLAPMRTMPTFSLAGQGWLMRSGGYRTTEQLMWYLSSQVDMFIAGKMFSQHDAGIYSVSRTIASVPVSKIAQVIKPIGFPAFSRLQSDRDLASIYLAKAMRLIAFASFPVFFGVAACSPEIVALLLGPNWSEAAIPISVLAVGMALRPTGLVIPSFLMGLGQFRASFIITTIGAGLFAVAYIVGSTAGLVGLCAAGALAYPIQFMLLVRCVTRVCGVSTTSLLRPLVPPLTCGLAMLVLILSARSFVFSHLDVDIRLVPLLMVGILSYTASSALLCRPLLHEIYSLVRL